MATKKPTKPRRRTALAKRQTSTPQAYTMTKKERELADAFRNRCDETAPAVGFRMKDEGNSLEVGLDHPDKAVGELLFMHALGTTNADFANGLINQLGNVLGKGKAINAAGLNHIVSMVQGIAPRDETEAMLAAQMAAIHNATMTAARRLNHVESIPQRDSASNMFNKLARTFTGQVEALKKYRSTGEQSIRVQHVNVSEGGQAIVGNVQTGGGGELENGGQSHEPSHALAQRPALPCDVQANQTAVPSPSRKGEDRVPLSRRARRSTKRQS
jgi:hypothetical protein